MILPKEGNILIVQDNPEDQKTRRLVRVRSVASDSSEIYCVLEKDRHIREINLTVKPKQVVLNLGTNPAPGRVYGQDTSKIYLGRKQHGAFGDLHFFVRPNKEQWQRFTVSMDRVARRLAKLKLGCLLDGGVTHEVHHRTGKYAGMFIKSSNTDKRPHRIEYYIDALVDSYDYLICHELGHYLHMVGLQDYPKVNAAWLRLYNQTIKPRLVTRERLKELVEGLKSQSAQPPNHWALSQDEDTLADWKVVFRWVHQVRGLYPKDLDTLWGETGEGCDDVLALLPRSDIHSKDVKPSVSEYATNSYKELFAEAFAFYMVKRDLPSNVHNLLEKSIPIARNALLSGGNDD